MFPFSQAFLFLFHNGLTPVNPLSSCKTKPLPIMRIDLSQEVTATLNVCFDCFAFSNVLTHMQSIFLKGAIQWF